MKIMNSADGDLINEAIDAIMMSHPHYAKLLEEEGWMWNSAIDAILQELLATWDNAWRSTIKNAQLAMWRKSARLSIDLQGGWVSAVEEMGIQLSLPQLDRRKLDSKRNSALVPSSDRGRKTPTESS